MESIQSILDERDKASGQPVVSSTNAHKGNGKAAPAADGISPVRSLFFPINRAGDFISDFKRYVRDEVEKAIKFGSTKTVFNEVTKQDDIHTYNTPSRLFLDEISCQEPEVIRVTVDALVRLFELAISESPLLVDQEYLDRHEAANRARKENKSKQMRLQQKLLNVEREKAELKQQWINAANDPFTRADVEKRILEFREKHG